MGGEKNIQTSLFPLYVLKLQKLDSDKCSGTWRGTALWLLQQEQLQLPLKSLQSFLPL